MNLTSDITLEPEEKENEINTQNKNITTPDKGTSELNLIIEETSPTSPHKDQETCIRSPLKDIENSFNSPHKDTEMITFNSPLKDKETTFDSLLKNKETSFNSALQDKETSFNSPHKDTEIITFNSPLKDKETPFDSLLKNKETSFNSPLKDKETTFDSLLKNKETSFNSPLKDKETDFKSPHINIGSEDEEDSFKFKRKLNKREIDLDENSNSSDDDQNKLITHPERPNIIDSENSDDDELFSKFKSKNKDQNKDGVNNEPIKYRSDIFDTEITDDEFENNDVSQTYGSDEDNVNNHVEKKKGKKSSKKTSKKPSFQDRQNEMKEIHSTSQRMIRDSEISLPYHRPKQRTLMEFLNRKKHIHPDRRKSLKMTMKDMSYLREIEERRKDVDKFYESDSDGENKCETNPEDTENNNEVSNKENESESKDNCLDLPDIQIENNFELDKEQEIQIGNLAQTSVDTNLMENNINTVEKINDKTEEALPKNTESIVDESEFEKCSDLTNESYKDSNMKEFANDCTMNENPSCIVKESSIDVNEENKISESDSEDDFRLHLDTEDFVETSCWEEYSELLNKKNKEDSSCENKNNHFDESGQISSENKKINQLKTLTPRLSLLAYKFPKFNLEKLNVTPKLSLGEDEFIDLEENSDTSFIGTKTGVSNLLDRFVKHSNTKRKPVKAQELMIGVVSKEVSSTGEEKLVHSEVSVNIKEEESYKEDTPGSKLTKLKDSLRMKLLEQRRKERERREQEKQFLDSEKVMQDYHEDGLPDEEGELTDDQNDTDAETESEPEEDDIILKDKKREKNVFLDEEAEEDEDNDEEEENEEQGHDSGSENGEHNSKMSENEESSDEDEFKIDKTKNNNRRKSRIIDDDDEDEFEIAYKAPLETEDLDLCGRYAQNNPLVEKRNVSSLSRTSTEDLFKSQTEEGFSNSLKSKAGEDSITDSHNHSLDMTGSSLFMGQPEKNESQKKNEKNVEDSQDFMNSNSLTPFSNLENFKNQNLERKSSGTVNKESALKFLLTPIKDSQMSSSNSESIKRSLLIDSPFKTQEKSESTKDDLLDLCSGKFSGNNTGKSNSLHLGEEVNVSETQDVRDLIGLCSGKFGTEDSQGFSINSTKEKYSGLLEEKTENSIPKSDSSGIIIDIGSSTDDEEEEEGSSMRETTSDKNSRKRVMTFSDEESDDGSINLEAVEYDENEEPIIQKIFTGFRDSKKGGIRSDFLENEAELSGSEEGSDDEELGEDDDMMEQEEGDLERFDQDELRNQVGKAHLKSLLDSDKRELRLLQEMYLEDGDLHGEGRQRKFRWKSVEAGDDDEADKRSDEEGEKEEELEEEAQWRKERFEREKYLQEEQLKNKELSTIEEGQKAPETSPVSLKFVKNISMKKTPIIPSNSTHSQDSPLFQGTLQKKGSFLNRNKEVLKRLAESTKEVPNVSGARQTGNFVFQTLTEEEVEKRSKKIEKANNKSKQITEPLQKKRRIERSFFSMEETEKSSSIFKHL